MLASFTSTLALALALALAIGCGHTRTIEAFGRTWRIDEVVAGVVEDHRQMLVLADERDSSPDGRDALVIARILYQRNHELLDILGEAIGSDGAAADTLVERVLDPQLRDADRLAFHDLVLELPATGNVRAAQQRLALIQKAYEEKLRQILERLEPQARGVAQPVPEPWEDYTAFLHQRYDRGQLLAKYDMYRQEGGAGARGIKWIDTDRQIVGRRLPPKTVVLTFDDGPHRRFTDSVLEILDRYHIKAVFFEVGQNVRRLPDRTRRILRAGHTVGNHSLTHAYLPRLQQPELMAEISSTSDAIKSVTAAAPVLFRAPYGAETEEILAVSTGLGMKAVLWNIDSLDWKDPLPESIAERVLRLVARDHRGIVLFHDIHRRTLAVLPLVIERLLADGYTFYAWNGVDFARPAPAPAPVAAGRP